MEQLQHHSGSVPQELHHEDGTYQVATIRLYIPLDPDTCTIYIINDTGPDENYHQRIINNNITNYTKGDDRND